MCVFDWQYKKKMGKMNGTHLIISSLFDYALSSLMNVSSIIAVYRGTRNMIFFAI